MLSGAVGLVIMVATANQPALYIKDYLGNLTFSATGSGNLSASGSETLYGQLNLKNKNCTTFANGGALTTTATGMVICSDDDGASGTFTSTGALQGVFDARYVKKQGDTMTGALIINNNLTVRGTMTGNHLFAGTFSGAGLSSCNGVGQKQLYNSSTRRFECGMDLDTTYTAAQGLTLLVGNSFRANATLTGSLAAFQTVSGSTVYASSALRSSGSIVWEGTASGAKIRGLGLVDCKNAITSKLLWDTTTGTFSCGTDTDTIYTAAQGLTLVGTSFKANATLTGSLASFQTISGAVVVAKSQLRSSGSLSVDGLTKLKSALTVTSSMSGQSLTISSLKNCDTIDTNGNGALTCGTDAAGSFLSSTGALQTQFDKRYVNTAGDTMTGGLLIYNNLRVNDRDQGNTYNGIGLDMLKVDPTAETVSIASSNFYVSTTGAMSLVDHDNGDIQRIIESVTPGSAQSLEINRYDGSAFFTLNSSSATIDTATFNADDLYFQDLNGTNAFTFSTDTTTLLGIIEKSGQTGDPFQVYGTNGQDVLTVTASGGEIVNKRQSAAVSADFNVKTKNNPKTLYIKASGSGVGFGTSNPDTAIEVIGTASGRQVHAQDQLRSSGSLSVQAAAKIKAGLTVLTTMSGGSTITFSGLKNCDTIDTNINGVLTCGSDTGGTYVAAQGLTLLTGNAFRANATLTGTLLNFQTISGSTLFARTTLRSSGTLVVSGATNLSGALTIKRPSGTATGNTLIVDTKGLVYDATNKRVGIGTTTTSQNLTINDTGVSANALIGLATAGGGVYTSGLKLFVFDTGHYAQILNQDTGNGGLAIGVADGGLTMTGIYIKRSNGRVGMGDASAPDTQLEVHGTMSGSGLNVGGTSTDTITQIFRGSATLDFPAHTAANQCNVLTITVNGVVDGDQVAIGVPNASVTTDEIFWGWVSATNTVSIRACANGTNLLNPASGTFKVTVFH